MHQCNIAASDHPSGWSVGCSQAKHGDSSFICIPCQVLGQPHTWGAIIEHYTIDMSPSLSQGRHCPTNEWFSNFLHSGVSFLKKYQVITPDQHNRRIAWVSVLGAIANNWYRNGESETKNRLLVLSYSCNKQLITLPKSPCNPILQTLQFQLKVKVKYKVQEFLPITSTGLMV